jgi:4-hydroxybenzoate polyprenyltransferase
VTSDLVGLLRPQQWVKNGFVLAAVVFSLHLGEWIPVARSLFAFVLFCAASSGAYVLNDILDADRDRAHADKRSRPLAAGRVPVPAAVVLAAGLAALALGGAAVLGPGMVACVASFLALQAAYSLWLKHVPLVDVVALSGGFVLRTAAGVVAAGARMSAWLFLATFLLALFLALAKRRHEMEVLGEVADGHRPVLAAYRRMPLDALIVAVATLVVGLYAQYTLSADVATRLGTDRLYLTAPFVTFGVFRYLFLVYGREQGGNPTDALLGDVPLLLAVGGWAVTVVALIYG